jgi:hypothetical protein
MEKQKLPTKGQIFRIKSALKCSYEEAYDCALIELILSQSKKPMSESQLQKEIDKRTNDSNI